MEQSHSIAVTIVDAISDNDFDSIPDQTVSVSTTDDDVAVRLINLMGL